jgi:hypothetical protein
MHEILRLGALAFMVWKFLVFERAKSASSYLNIQSQTTHDISNNINYVIIEAFNRLKCI